MSSVPPNPSESNRQFSSDFHEDDSIDLRELFRKTIKGTYQILGLSLVGLTIACLASLGTGRLQPSVTQTRVAFTFPGFERGQYPDNSKFQPDDLRSPTLLAEALRRQGLDSSSDFQSHIRGALSVEGIVPPNIIKERDRLRASGQTPAPYIPDEYVLSLSMRPSAGISNAQREHLLGEIVAVYRENFYRTYGQPPLAFGTAFDTLKKADFAEYELVLNSEVDKVRAYLSRQSGLAKSFRSPTTNLSFADLMEQAELFAQIQLNEVLGIIRQNGLSRNRPTAMLKMNYHLRLLDDRERRALENEKVVRDLLNQALARTQNVVLGVKGQNSSTRSDGPIVDQGLIDSLLANDSYNFLVRRALDAGLEVKAIQAEKHRIIDQRDNMKSFLDAPSSDQTTIIAQASESLKTLETAYFNLIENIRKTHTDFTQQEYANAVRVSDEIRTPRRLRPMMISGLVGAFLGFALATGLSLLGVYVGRGAKTA